MEFKASLVYGCNHSTWRVRQEDLWEFMASVDYRVNLRLAWTTWPELVSKRKRMRSEEEEEEEEGLGWI